MKIVSGTDMQKMERWAMEVRHIPELLLMENAGRAVASHAWQCLNPARNQVVILAGKGNNGGDALVAARHLHQWGADVRLFLLNDPHEFTNAAKENWGFIEAAGIRWYVLQDANSFYPLKLCLETAAVAVDGILGSGFKGALAGNYLQAVQTLNQGSASVVSIDLPSGIDANTGQKANEAVQAWKTVTMAYGKQGLYIYPGRSLAGQVVVEDISLPNESVELLESPTEWVDAALAYELLPKILSDSHKGVFGHVLSIAGSKGMMGAALLAALSILRSGGGLVTSGVPDKLADGFDLALAEGMTLVLPSAQEEGLALAAADTILAALDNKQALLLGPGLKRHENLPIILEQVLRQTEVPAVLDAGALWALQQNPAITQQAKGACILTPHPGELAGLLHTTVAAIQADRCAAARQAAKDYNSIVILKGASSLIVDPAGQLFINSTGSAALATAGSGDVLAGAVAAWLAQGLKPLAAALLATYLHGAAGDQLMKQYGERGGLSGEVAELLPAARKALIQENESKKAAKKWHITQSPKQKSIQ